MNKDLFIKNNIIIPYNELIISTSRSGGPGGQHVNKTNTKITLRWNIINTKVLSDQDKAHIIKKLQNQLSTDGDLIIHNTETSSQLENKKRAMRHLKEILIQSLEIPKKRKKTNVSKAKIESRLHSKSRHSKLKKMRSKVSLSE